MRVRSVVFLFAIAAAACARKPAPAPLIPQRIAANQTDDTGERTVIDGNVVVTDAAGVEHPKENGTLVPWVRTAQSLEDDNRAILEHGPLQLRRLDPVVVTKGRFHLELPWRPGELHVTLQMTLDGRPALFDEGFGEATLIDDAKRGTVTLHVHWIERAQLHVVDQESGRELDDVTIARRRDVPRGRRRSFGGEPATRDSYHPGRSADLEMLLDHARSPLVVHPHFVQGSLREMDEWFVRARGHAWGRINLHFDSSVERTTERTLDLAAGATLVVDIQGELPKPRVTPSGETLVPMLRLSQATQMAGMPVKLIRNGVVAEEPAALGETTFESLEATPLTASLEFGRASDSPRILQHVQAELTAGATTRVAILLTPEVVPQPVALAGTLFIPKGWAIPDAHLLIRSASQHEADDSERRDLPLAQLAPLPDRPGCFSWSAGTLLPAEYEFTVDAAGFAQLETIGPDGNDHVELALAEPAHLDVDVVDEATGEKVALEWVAWNATHAESMPFGSGQIQLRYDPLRRLYSGVVPIGEGVVSGPYDKDWTFDDARTVATIHSGDPQLTVTVHRSTGVAVELWSGATSVPWTEPLVAQCTVEALDDPATPIFRTLRSAMLVVSVTVPGRYRVTIPEIPGYAPVDPFEINLPEGRLVTRAIYLTKP